MKTIVLQFMLEGSRPCTILCFNVHTTFEYLNKNVSIGQLLQHISKSIVVCAGSRPKRQSKTYNKEVCQVSKPLPLINYGFTKSHSWLDLATLSFNGRVVVINSPAREKDEAEPL